MGLEKILIFVVANPLNLAKNEFNFENFYRCTVHSDIYAVHSPTKVLFIKLREV